MIKNKKGFTLIELIIVMAIIGILAVVAIVAIAGKSSQARDARRQADMSAVQTGLALYCYDVGTSGTVTCSGALGATVKLNTCTDAALALQIALAGVKDPQTTADSLACTNAITRVSPFVACEYGVTLSAENVFNPCDYTIYALLENEGTNGRLVVTEAGQKQN